MHDFYIKKLLKYKMNTRKHQLSNYNDKEDLKKKRKLDDDMEIESLNEKKQSNYNDKEDLKKNQNLDDDMEIESVLNENKQQNNDEELKQVSIIYD